MRKIEAATSEYGSYVKDVKMGNELLMILESDKLQELLEGAGYNMDELRTLAELCDEVHRRILVIDDLLGKEFIARGLNAESEPNELGKEIEHLRDEVFRLSPYY